MANDVPRLATSVRTEDARAVDDDARGLPTAPPVSAAEVERTRAQFTAMLRTSLLPTAVVGVLAVVVAALLGDATSAWSAALGAGLVIVFFSLSLLVMRQTAHLQPIAVMSVVLAVYTGKILALGIALITLYDASWLDGQPFALAMIACTCVWLAFEMRAFTRMRVLVAPGADDERPADDRPEGGERA